MKHKIKPVLALLSEGSIDTDYGRFRMSVFHDGNEQAIVLSVGELAKQDDVICRIHSECISSHVFFGRTCDCREQMIYSQKLISDAEKGLIIYLEQEGRGCGAAAHVATLDLKEQGVSQPDAYRRVGFPKDIRRFDIAAKVIQHMQIKSVVLVSSNRRKRQTLEDWGVKVSSTRDLDGFVPLGESMRNVEDYIVSGAYDSIVDRNKNKKWVFVIGDLNVDYWISQENPQQVTFDKPKPIVGGTAFNSAKAFKDRGFETIVFGGIGHDSDGQLVRKELECFFSLVKVSKDKPTGNCFVIFNESAKQRMLIKEEDNANDYDLDSLKQAVRLSGIGEEGFVFMGGHPFVRLGINQTKELINLVSRTNAKIILDLVPHNLYETISLSDFNYAVGNKVDVIISAYSTLIRFINHKATREDPIEGDWEKLWMNFRSKFLLVRYGAYSISRQAICRRGDDGFQILEDKDTGYLQATLAEKRGFGDALTADFLLRYQDSI